MVGLPQSLIDLGEPSNLPETDQQWMDLLGLLPGYDPFRGAEEAKLWFDVDEAIKRLEFFHEGLHLVEGKKAAQKFVLERWQQSFVANLFGWKREDGTRRYREAMLYIPRKNGKTPMAAGILLSVMLQDHEPGAQIYSAGADQKQAKLIYKHVKGMIKSEPEFGSRLRCYPSNSSVTYDAEDAVYMAISADAHTKHGYSTHLGIVDELHTQPNGDLVEVLETSTGARTQPLMVYITTADFDRESVCNERHKYAEEVRSGVINDLAFLPAVYQIDREDDWTDEATWAKANPNLGVSLELDYLRKACKKAQAIPRLEAAFRRLHLNQKTQSDVVWISLGRWDACDAEPLVEAELEGLECFGGLDLANTMDINAHVMVFPHEDGSVTLLPRFWIPEDRALEREKRDRVPYIQWAREGWITLTPGETSDYDRIREDILADSKRFNIRDIGVDRWNSLQIANQLQGEGLTLTDFGQGYKSMNAPSKHLEVMVVSRKVRHGANPVLRWMISNARIQSDPAGNIKPTKQKSTEKIDGVVAAVMGLGRWMASEEEERSVYETRGVIEL